MIYRIELSDRNFNRLEYLEKEAVNISWEYSRIGGCGSFSFDLPRSLCDEKFISGDFNVKILRRNPENGNYDLWYQGFIERKEPVISGSNEYVRVEGHGYQAQLGRILLTETYTGQEISAIVKDILDTYVVPNTDIEYDNPDEDFSGLNHIVSEFGNASYEIAVSKFGGGSLLLDGSGDYLTIPDHASWDVYNSLLDSWTIDMWIKFSAAPAGTQVFICQRQDVNNSWAFYHVAAGGLRFNIVSGGSEEAEQGGAIADTEWHHVALVKIADKVGIYKDGAQVVYKQITLTGAFASVLYIGQNGNSANYYQGYIDELRVINGNPFTASPNSGLTDTISVPTSEHSPDANTKLLLHFNTGIEITSFTPDSLEFKNVSALNALQTCADVTGAIEFGVDRNRKFFFRGRNSSVNYRFPASGGKMTGYSYEDDFSAIVNHVFIQGGDVSGSPFTYEDDDALSQVKYGRRDLVVQNSAIVTDAVAQQFINAIFAEFSDVVRRGKCSLVDFEELIEDLTPLGLFLPIVRGVTYGEKKYGTFLYSGRLSFQINRINYSVGQQADLKIDIALGELRPDEAEYLSRLENKIEAIRTQGL